MTGRTLASPSPTPTAGQVWPPPNLKPCVGIIDYFSGIRRRRTNPKDPDACYDSKRPPTPYPTPTPVPARAVADKQADQIGLASGGNDNGKLGGIIHPWIIYLMCGVVGFLVLVFLYSWLRKKQEVEQVAPAVHLAQTNENEYVEDSVKERSHGVEVYSTRTCQTFVKRSPENASLDQMKKPQQDYIRAAQMQQDGIAQSRQVNTMAQQPQHMVGAHSMQTNIMAQQNMVLQPSQATAQSMQGQAIVQQPQQPSLVAGGGIPTATHAQASPQQQQLAQQQQLINGGGAAYGGQTLAGQNMQQQEEQQFSQQHQAAQQLPAPVYTQQVASQQQQQMPCEKSMAQ